jgi:hypothetical protein
MVVWPHVLGQNIMVGVYGRETSSLHCWQEAERMRQKLGSGITLKGPPTPSDLLPPAKPHLLKFVHPPKIASPTRFQTFKHISLWRTLHMEEYHKQPLVKGFTCIASMRTVWEGAGAGWPGPPPLPETGWMSGQRHQPQRLWFLHLWNEDIELVEVVFKMLSCSDSSHRLWKNIKQAKKAKLR